MKPKFEVGEVVILQSITHPHYNGEYTVEAVIPTKGTYKCRLTNDKFTHSHKGYAYLLDSPLKVKAELPFESAVDEPALRKKHQPGEMSFTNLMSQLNQPVTA